MNPNPNNYSQHEGISCDHCLKSNFRGKRYKCLVCQDYDLCSSCYEIGTVPPGKRHTSEHPVQCILTRNDYEIYFGGEQNPIEQTIQSFTCPLCGKMGFTENLLYEHSVQEHSDTLNEVICPICCSSPQNFEPVVAVEDFTSHLSIEHRSGRGVSPQTSRGRRVPHTNRSGINPARNRRQLTPATVTMLSNINPLISSLPHDQSSSGINGQIRDLEPITEILSQLRRSQNALLSNSFNNTNSNALHLHLDRNNFRSNTLRQVFERPAEIVVRRHNNQSSLNQPTQQQTTTLSSNNVSGFSYLMDSLNNINQLTNAQGQTVPTNLNNQGNNQPSSNQFLLSTCKEKPKISKELEDAQKVEKSLFIQELLISSIENFFKHDLKFHKNDKKDKIDNQQLSMSDQSTKNSQNNEQQIVEYKNDTEDVRKDKYDLQNEQIRDNNLVDEKVNKELATINNQENSQTNNLNNENNNLNNQSNSILNHSSNEINNQFNNSQIIKNENNNPIEQPQTKNDEILTSSNFSAVTTVSNSTNIMTNNEEKIKQEDQQAASKTSTDSCKVNKDGQQESSNEPKNDEQSTK